MTLRLVDATEAVARAVCDHGDVDGALAELELLRVPDWPHPDTTDALRPLAEHPALAGEGTFLVVHDGRVVGDCGWFGPAGTDGSVEIGYGLAPSMRRRGHGAAAVRLLLAWVKAQPGVTVVRAEVLPGNGASLALLAGLGFMIEGHRSGHVQLSRMTAV